MFTESQAKDAILRLAKSKGIDRAALIERMFRHETGHFTSGQYKKTGSAGMEVGKWPGIPNNISFVTMRDNHDNRMAKFIVWNDVYDFCIYLSDYIDRHGGNWSRWNSTKVSTQKAYINKVAKVRSRWITNSKLKIEEVELDKNGNVQKIKNSEVWNTKVGEQSVVEELEEVETPVVDEFILKATSITEQKASGIWQIIKLVSDQYSLSQNINDATMAFNQGSLLNFVQKVIQKPWLQFWGDTVGDQYYFFSRKEPFDYSGFIELPIVKEIQENEVLSDDLGWYEGDIYSWYQIIPRGSFLGEQNLMFAYVKAVFFEEYAKIWGSKPNIQVSNYVNFVKINEDNKMFRKALKDLRYMVESNAYLPFTRQGTIVIGGDNTIRRGYRIYYQPTGEYFYIDSVSHSYSTSDGGPSYTTTLRVSRGVVKRHFHEYFRLIDFDNPPPLTQKYKELIKDKGIAFYFDNGRTYLINPDENFENSSSRTDIKMVQQISEFPTLRNELFETNQRNLKAIVDLIKRHKGKKFLCYGNMDEDAIIKFPRLARDRSETIKSMAIQEYLKHNNDMTKEELEANISTQWNAGEGSPFIEDGQGGFKQFDDGAEGSSLKERAYKRNSLFGLEPYEEEKEKEVEQEGVAWKVNRKVFNFFLNRKQFISDDGR
jgi:hypothetical protein